MQMLPDHRGGLIKRALGSEQAATELYGLGVRIGMYLQGIAFLFRLTDTEPIPPMSITLIPFSIYCGWAKVVSRRTISPAESLVVMGIIAVVYFPNSISLTYFIRKEKFTITTALASALNFATMWFSKLAVLWFWSVGWKVLPRLETENVTFFFAKIAIDNRGYRIFALTYAIISTIQGLVSTRSYLRIQISPQPHDIKILFRSLWVGSFYLGFVSSITVLIVGVELSIVWNKLEPNTDLAAPSQLIPLVGGIISMVEAVLQRVEINQLRRQDNTVSEGVGTDPKEAT